MPAQDQEDDRRSRTGLLWLLALLLALLIGGAAYLLPGMFESPPEQDRVPDVIGMKEKDARSALGDAGFDNIDVEYRPDSDVRANRVLEQDPNADQFAEPGSLVTLVVSEGAPLVEVPYVIGFTREEAEAEIEGRGLEATFEERESDEPAGIVVATDPNTGDSIAEGSTVTVFYSDGPEEVPDVRGMKQSEAKQVLTDAGFNVSVVKSSDTTEPKGTVIDQSPGPGEKASDGSTVTIVVSSYEEPTEEPSESPSETASDDPTLPTESPSTEGNGG